MYTEDSTTDVVFIFAMSSLFLFLATISDTYVRNIQKLMVSINGTKRWDLGMKLVSIRHHAKPALCN